MTFKAQHRNKRCGTGVSCTFSNRNRHPVLRMQKRLEVPAAQALLRCCGSKGEPGKKKGEIDL
jgi:hypothetical protein